MFVPDFSEEVIMHKLLNIIRKAYQAECTMVNLSKNKNARFLQLSVLAFK